MPSKEEFRRELSARFRRAAERNATVLEVNSGELHRSLGGYPGPKHQMPSCCDVMYEAAGKADEIVASPPSGRGASLAIRYRIPRP